MLNILTKVWTPKLNLIALDVHVENEKQLVILYTQRVSHCQAWAIILVKSAY